jgi:hypothetical protein
MNTTLLRAFGIRADAPSTQSTMRHAPRGDFADDDRAANGVPVVGQPIRTNHIVRVGAVSAAVALSGLLAINWSLFTTARSSSGPRASMVSSTASTTSAGPAAMDIVPTPVNDPSSGYFVGTGDGSAGSWIRP